MKRKIIIAALFICATAFAGATLITVKANDIIALYKPQIEASISKAIGAAVTLGEIDVSLFPRVKLRVNAVSFTDEQRRSLPLSLSALKTDLALIPLLSKRLEVSSLELLRPQLTLVRTNAGVTVEGLNFGDSRDRNSHRGGAPGDTSSATPSQASPPLSLQIKQVKVVDGEIIVDDRTAKRKTAIKAIQLLSRLALEGQEVMVPEASLRFSSEDLSQSIEIATSGLTFNQQSKVLSLGSSMLSTTGARISATGEVAMASGGGTVALKSTEEVSLEKLVAAFSRFQPHLPSPNVKGSTSFSLKVTGPTSASPVLDGTLSLSNVSATSAGSTIAGATGLISFKGPVSSLVLDTKDLALSYQGTSLVLGATAEIRPDAITVTKSVITGFGGATSLDGALALHEAKPFQTRVSARDLHVTDLLTAFAPTIAQQISGTLSSVTLQTKGSLSTPNIVMNTAGSGTVTLRNGVIKQSNLPQTILTKAESLALGEGLLRKQIPPEFEGFFASPDTQVKECSVDFSFVNGALKLTSLKLVSDLFSIDGSGTVSADGQLNLQTTFYFSKQFSTALAERNKQVKTILAADGRLILPLELTGKPPAIVAYPNFTKVIETGAAMALQQKASSVFEKALGGNKGKNKDLSRALKGVLGLPQ